MDAGLGVARSLGAVTQLVTEIHSAATWHVKAVIRPRIDCPLHYSTGLLHPMGEVNTGCGGCPVIRLPQEKQNRNIVSGEIARTARIQGYSDPKAAVQRLDPRRARAQGRRPTVRPTYDADVLPVDKSSWGEWLSYPCEPSPHREEGEPEYGGPREGRARKPPCPRREGPLSGFSIPSWTKCLRPSVMAGEVHGLAAPPHRPPQRHLRRHHATFVQTKHPLPQLTHHLEEMDVSYML